MMFSKVPGFAEREGLLGGGIMPDGAWSRSNGMELIRRAKKEFGDDMKVIAGVIGPGVDPDGWADLLEECRENGAVAADMSLISQMFAPEITQQAAAAVGEAEIFPGGAGLQIGVYPEGIVKLLSAMRDKTSLPMMPKITPELGCFRLMKASDAYRKAGAAAITLVHGFIGVAPPDIYNHGKTTFPFAHRTTWWTLSGSWNRFAMYRDVAAAGRYGGGIDIYACGGMVRPEHCIEAMMLGAKRVQLSSGIFYNGLSYAGKVVDFMKKYMEEQGYNTPYDCIGLGQKYLGEMGEVQAEFKEQIGNLIAVIDYNKCDNCGTCLDTWCFATEMEGGVPKVISERCSSCGLCVYRCPVGARSMQWTKGEPAYMRES